LNVGLEDPADKKASFLADTPIDDFYFLPEEAFRPPPSADLSSQLP